MGLQQRCRLRAAVTAQIRLLANRPRQSRSLTRLGAVDTHFDARLRDASGQARQGSLGGGRRRGGRVAEGGGLLNRYTPQRRIKGSNPFVSAN